MPRDNALLEVELPAGGKIHVQTEAEVDLWQGLSDRYQREYRLAKVNDLTGLGNLLLQHLAMYRAQTELSGLEVELDEEGVATGRMKKVDISTTRAGNLQDTINRASKEIREIERAMGIDKKSREQSGSQTIADYLTRLKGFGREFGIHISARVHAYEEFVNELRWRVRLEQNGDPEDKAYHSCTPEGILEWARTELAALEEVDKAFAREKGKLAIGKV